MSTLKMYGGQAVHANPIEILIEKGDLERGRLF